jgi:hypothetical protein
VKKLLPIIIVVVVVAAGAYFFLGKGKTGMNIPGVSKQQKFATLKAAVELGVPMKCTYQVAGAEYEGYIKGEKWRGKVKSADGKVGEVIVKDNCMWTWSSDEDQGVKLCFEPAEGEESVWDQESFETQDIEYNCLPAAITDAQFEPPSDIQFMDMDQMMNQMMEGAGY